MSQIVIGKKELSQRGGVLPLILAALVFVLVVLGAGVAWWFYGRGGTDSFAYTDLVKMAPKDSFVFVSADLDKLQVDTKEVFNNIEFKLAQKKDENFKGDYEEFKQNFKKATGLEWNESTFALLMPQKLGFYFKTNIGDTKKKADEYYNTADTLLVAELSREADVLSLFDSKLVEAAQEKKWQVSEDKGIHIFQKDDFKFAWIIKNGWLFAAPNPEVIRKAWDRRHTSDNLEKDEHYQEALQSIKFHDASVFYVASQSIFKSIDPNAVDQKLGEAFKQIPWLMIGSEGSASGRKADGLLRVVLDPNSPYKELFPISSKTNFSADNLVSQDALMFMDLDLRALWDAVYNLAGKVPEMSSQREMPKMLLMQQGVDLDADLLDVMTGEIAFYIPNLKVEENTPPEAVVEIIRQNKNFVLLVGVKDVSKMQATLEKLPMAVLKTAEAKNHAGVDYKIGTPETAFGFIDGFLVISFSEQVFKEFIETRGKNTVAQIPLRQSVKNDFAQPALFSLFVSAEGMKVVGQQIVAKTTSAAFAFTEQGMRFVSYDE